MLLFFILLFYFILCPFESWLNPMFDLDLNKYKIWKRKGKPGSFLVTLKWSDFWDVLEIFMFETQKHFSSWLLHKIEFKVRGRYIHDFLVWICLDLIYQLECLLYDIRRLCALVFHFSGFLNFMPIWRFWEVLEIFMFETNTTSLHARLHKIDRVYG